MLAIRNRQSGTLAWSDELGKASDFLLVNLEKKLSMSSRMLLPVLVIETSCLNSVDFNLKLLNLTRVNMISCFHGSIGILLDKFNYFGIFLFGM